MSDTFIVLVECMREMFPEMEEMEVAPEIKLEEIPEWDSMSLVNLQTGSRPRSALIYPQWP